LKHVSTQKEASMRARSTAIAILFTLTTGLAAAPRSLTMDEAVDLALKNNKEVAAAKIGIDRAEARVLEAIGNALPTLSLSAVYQRNVQVPVFFIPNFQDPSAGLSPVRVGLNNQYNVGLQASQILFNSAVFTGIGASKIYEHAAKEQANAVIAKVVTDTKKSFYMALLAREFAGISRASLKNGEENLATIRLLFKEGLVAEFDAIRAEVGVENIRPFVTQAEAGYRNAVSALQTQMGVGLTEEYEPSGSFDSTLLDIPTEEQAVLRALSENYDIRAMELQEKVMDEFVSIYRSDYFPTLALYGNWTNQGQSDTFRNFVSASSSAVGLNLSLNLFNGMRSQAKVEQAQADKNTVAVQVQQVKDGIRLQVRAVLNNLASAKQRITAQQRTVEQAQRGYEISQIRYREGTGSLLEINDADLALSQARNNKIQALHDYYSAKADLDRLLANLDAKYFVHFDRH
jgi:outer membrane protein